MQARNGFQHLRYFFKGRKGQFFVRKWGFMRAEPVDRYRPRTSRKKRSHRFRVRSTLVLKITYRFRHFFFTPVYIMDNFHVHSVQYKFWWRPVSPVHFFFFIHVRLNNYLHFARTYFVYFIVISKSTIVQQRLKMGFTCMLTVNKYENIPSLDLTRNTFVRSALRQAVFQYGRLAVSWIIRKLSKTVTTSNEIIRIRPNESVWKVLRIETIKSLSYCR